MVTTLYYESIYGGSDVPEAAFPTWAKRAEARVNADTFGRSGVVLAAGAVGAAAGVDADGGDAGVLGGRGAVGAGAVAAEGVDATAGAVAAEGAGATAGAGGVVGAGATIDAVLTVDAGAAVVEGTDATVDAIDAGVVLQSLSQIPAWLTQEQYDAQPVKQREAQVFARFAAMRHAYVPPQDADALGALNDAVRHAVCAIAEVLYAAHARGKQGGAVTREAVGSWSRTYAAGASSVADERAIYALEELYLGDTNLLYRGCGRV